MQGDDAGSVASPVRVTVIHGVVAGVIVEEDGAAAGGG